MLSWIAWSRFGCGNLVSLLFIILFIHHIDDVPFSDSLDLFFISTLNRVSARKRPRRGSN